ncbi:sensor histidine kinase [Bacillus sp. AK128]
MSSKFSIFPRRYGFFPYIWLVYLSFPIYFVSIEQGLKQVIGFGLLAVFLVTYRQLYNSPQEKLFAFWLAIQLLIIFVFCLFYNLNFIFLGFFAANFIGWFTDKKQFRIGLGSLFFVEIVPIAITIAREGYSFQLFNVIPFVIIMLVTPFGIRSMYKRMELEEQLDQANQQIEELVKREERLRIARDLHDTLGHTLSLLTLKSQLVQRLAKVDSEKARLEAKEIERTSRAALKQVRELVTDMRATTITEELLQIQEILKASNINYQYNGKEDFEGIPSVTQNILCMCLREAITNVVKHSQASNCDISISQEDYHCSVVIHDDGIGLEDEHVIGNGLKGMKERLELIDGLFTIRGKNGTRVEITLPIIKKGTKEGKAV